MRPNFFTNTQDILHEYLQHGGVPAFKIRAVLAAMLSPTWGIYSGLRAVRERPAAAGQRGVPGFGEVPVPTARLGAAAGTALGIADYITELNRIRRAMWRCTGCVICASIR
jgi:starch synthase (maltosyl-transferring)